MLVFNPIYQKAGANKYHSQPPGDYCDALLSVAFTNKGVLQVSEKKTHWRFFRQMFPFILFLIQPPTLTWRPLNFSSGLSTRGKLRRGIPTVASGRCRGRGVGAARWVGWKLLITHDTWWKTILLIDGLLTFSSYYWLQGYKQQLIFSLTRKAAMAPPVMKPARTSFQWFLCSVTLITPTSTARDSSARHKVGFVKRVPLARNMRVMYICKKIMKRSDSAWVQCPRV